MVNRENFKLFKMDKKALDWVCEELSRLLGTEATEDIARYLLSIENKNDLREYMNELLDSSLPQNRHFISELLKKWKELHSYAVDDHHKDDNEKASHQLHVTPISFDLPKQSKKGKKKSIENVSPNVSASESGSSHTTPGSSGKKTTFVPLFSNEGQQRTVAMLPGRHHCECQAMKHSLVNNCLSCGRIVCQQEGPGPCLFCGNLVCTKDQQEILSHNSKKSEKLRNHLMSQTMVSSSEEAIAQGYEKALQHKNKLLEFDRTSMKRTQVIDDESDYFSTDANQWLKDGEKAALRKHEEDLRSIRHASRKDRKITLTLDFAGRQVVEEKSSVDTYNASDPVVQAINFSVSEDPSSVHAVTADDVSDNLVNPNINLTPPKFISEGNERKNKASTKPSRLGNSRTLLRVQDGDLEQMSDNGMALSMHQPWASLLVCGIKRHEGRTWYTQHRGTLWIAATAKTPTQDEIDLVENQYRHYYNDPCLQFPDSYPIGCLLGCVEVTDCLAQEDYVEQYPNGESESPYVFICENPRELRFKFPMKGKHKIYKLESHLHKAAKKGIAGLVDSSSS